jgi:hypothetical protein
MPSPWLLHPQWSFTVYEQVLEALGLKGDLVRCNRDQSYSIEIAARPRSRSEEHPSGPEKWRLTDPWSEMDVAYSLSQSARLILCITDSHIQNLYQEWEEIEMAAQACDFVLFCLDQDYKDLQVEGGPWGFRPGVLHQQAGGSGDTGGGAHGAGMLRGKFYLLAADCFSGVPG